MTGRLTRTARFHVFDRDGFACCYCGRKPPEVVLEVDHVIPRTAGGSNDPSNLVTACSDCNIGKGARVVPIAPQFVDAEQMRGAALRRQRVLVHAWEEELRAALAAEAGASV